jgi:hypothetical protein
MPAVIASQDVALAVQTAICGVNWSGSSSADARTNTRPAAASGCAQIPDPQVEQKPRVIWRPLSARDRKFVILPLNEMLPSGTPIMAAWPEPAVLRQSVQ